jgi:hypothetical protein
MSELKFRKIHVDSRLRSSGTSNNFEYSLAETFDTPEGTVCYVDNVVLPHSWSSIDTTNNWLYIAERVGAGPSYTYTVRKLELTTGNFSGTTYRTALLTALNHNTPTGVPASYTALYILTTNKVIIASPDTDNVKFHFLTDDELKIYNNSPNIVNKNENRSGNGVLRNREGGSSSSADGYEYYTDWTSGFLDLLSHHSVYISSSLASFNTLGPMGQSDIVCKVPVNSSYGSTIHHSVSSAQDFIEVGHRTITSISFSILDAYSRPINLEGASWSLSLVFAIRE